MATCSGQSCRRPVPDPIKVLWHSWLARKRPVFKVAAKFVALMVPYYAFILLFSERDMAHWTTFIARIASYVLNCLGEKSQIIGNTIASGQFAVTVHKECAGFDHAWFFIAALIAFPSRWARKIPGILVGIAVILALNMGRIMSLYFLGVHFPGALDAVHEKVWPILSVVAILSLMVGWVGWARRCDAMR